MALWNIFALMVLSPIVYASENSMVRINNGGYEDIIIAINPNVTEDNKIITSIQSMVEEASDYLFIATQQRLFIRSVKIIIPITWSNNTAYGKLKTETYEKADIIIANSLTQYGLDPYTLQYEGCGKPGRYIHFTPEFLVKDMSNTYGPQGRVFVHEWAHLRWGVFDEYNSDFPFYFGGHGQKEATRCSLDITGKVVKRCNLGVCAMEKCNEDPISGLYENGCIFLPDKNQLANASIMYMQSQSSIISFCDANNHNTEAPNLQNRVCNSKSTWEVIMNSSDIKSSPPNAIKSPPSFSILQYRDRVVTLVLDVSGSMGGKNRKDRLHQAAVLFVQEIIELNSYVGIVIFSSSASIVSNLVRIVGESDRLRLKNLIPKSAGGGTNICSGILEGIKVNFGFDKSSYGTELVLLSDGEDNYNTRLCFPQITASGTIIHIISLGENEATAVTDLKKMTGGITFLATDSLDSNGLIDAFNGLLAQDGNISKQSIQLESTVSNTRPNTCLNGTVYIDNTVGNETFFLVTWQSAIPAITLEDPTGYIHPSSQFVNDTTSKSSSLKIPGTAKVGPWHYSICNTYTLSQALGITINSRASSANVSPIVVNAHMSSDLNQYPSPMVVYASVSQGMKPIKGVNITAIIEPVTGSPENLQLLDNGAGADIVKHDGIYSRYFFNFSKNGRYSLKVRVESRYNKTRLALPRNRALYIPGYVENGQFVMNPPRPVVSDDDLEINTGPFSRTALGGSFVLSDVPAGPQQDIYGPEKITDLEAKIEEGLVVLSWTATGDDLDQGSATSYDLRMGISPKDLRDDFDYSILVDISRMKPQPAGSNEIFTFVPKYVVLENGTILYFALIAVDEVSHKSDMSNIAQAARFIPAALATTTIQPSAPKSTTITTLNPPKKDNSGKLSIAALAVIVCSCVILVAIIISITVCVVSCNKKSKLNEIKL